MIVMTENHRGSRVNLPAPRYIQEKEREKCERGSPRSRTLTAGAQYSPSHSLRELLEELAQGGLAVWVTGPGFPVRDMRLAR